MKEDEAPFARSEEEAVSFTLDEALQEIGFGTFHYRLLLVCGISWMADAVEMTLLSYLIPNAQEEFDLSEFWSSFLGSAVFIGMWIGAVFFGILSDLKGRRLGYFSSTTMTFIFSAASAFAPSYWLLVVLRALAGLGIGGITIPFTLFAEFLPSESRGTYLVFLNVFWTVGTLFAAGMAWAIIPTIGWRWFVFVGSLPVLIPLLLFKITPESPRYYFITGQHEKLINLLKKAARMNKKEFPSHVEIVGGSVTEDRGSMKELLSPHLRRSSILLWALWFVNTCSYYGIVLLTPDYFHVGNEDTSAYLDVFLTCLAEFPGLFVAAYLINYRGRKQALAFLLGGFSVFCSLLLIPGPAALSTTFACLTRGAMLGAYATIFVYTPEVYPTKLRATGLGACSSFSRIGGMLAPFIAKIGVDSSEDPNMTGPIISFAVLCAFGSILSILLPLETKNRNLEDLDAAVKPWTNGIQTIPDGDPKSESNALLEGKQEAGS